MTESPSSGIYDRRGVRKSLFHTAVFRAASPVATLASYIVLVRALSEHEFGVFNLLYAFIPVISAIAGLGIEQVLKRYQPEYLGTGQKAAAAWLVRIILSTRFVTNMLALAIVFAAWQYIAPLFKLAPYKLEFALFLILIIIHFQGRILQFSLASHMLHRFSVGSLTLVPIVKLLVYGVLFWQDDLDLRAAILADTLAYGVAFLLLTVVHERHCVTAGVERNFRPDAAEKRRLIRYGLYNNFNDAGTLVLGARSDNFFIAAMMNAAAVGAYSFYARLSDMISNATPGRVFENLIQPLFFSIPREEARNRIPRLFTLLLNSNLVPYLGAFAFSFAYHAEIVQVLFGGKFIDHSWLLPVVVGFATLNVIAVPVTLVAQHEEKAQIILYSKVTVIYQLIATLTLIPVMGLYGAALATGSANLAKNLFIWWFVRDNARWLNFAAVLITSLLLWGTVIVLAFALKTAIPAPPLVHLFLGGILCVVGALVYLRSPAIAQSDREILGEVLHGKEQKLLRWVGLLPRGAV